MKSNLNSVVPKLPSTNLLQTRDFYIQKLNFKQAGQLYPDYLMLYRDNIEIHFFLHEDLNKDQNDGMCYVRVTNVDEVFQEFKKALPDLKAPEAKPWGQKEFYFADNDNNCFAVGESIA